MIQQFPFGRTAAGQTVTRYRLTNSRNMSVDVLNLGGIIQSINVPTPFGGSIDVVLGYDSAAQYEAEDGYLGAAIGRWANRIGRARFKLGGQSYSLTANDGRNHLHGGPGGFHNRLWQGEADGERLILSRLSPDGEEGYPGRLETRLEYALSDENELIVTFEAQSDRDTAVNLTNHTYFNLNGDGDILDHELTLAADFFSEVDEELIPTGRLRPVEGTPFDFRVPKRIGRDIEGDDPQLAIGGGYDHNFVISKGPDQPFAAVSAPSGLRLTVQTNQPGVQFYSGNFLTPRRGKGGRLMGRRSGFCLETQLFPDSINQADPAPILRAGETYYHSVIYRFSPTATG